MSKIPGINTDGELILPGDRIEDSVELEWLREQGLWIKKDEYDGAYYISHHNYASIQRKDRFYNNLKKATL